MKREGEAKEFSLWWPLGIGAVAAVGLAIFYVSRGGDWTWPAVLMLGLAAVLPALRVYSGRKARQAGAQLRRRRDASDG